MSYRKQRRKVNGKFLWPECQLAIYAASMAGLLLIGAHRPGLAGMIAFIYSLLIWTAEHRAYDRELAKMAREVMERGNDQ